LKLVFIAVAMKRMTLAMERITRLDLLEPERYRLAGNLGELRDLSTEVALGRTVGS